MRALSIANTLVPSQRHTQQNFPNPREFAPDDWQFNPNRAQQLDWQPLASTLSTTDFYSNREAWKTIKNGMFNPLTGAEPIFGHVDYLLNPLEQEQTNAKTFAYQAQKVTRVADNMSPAGSMRMPTYRYPVGAWQNVYQGSRAPPNQARPFSNPPQLI
jgi:hypothetical protein